MKTSTDSQTIEIQLKSDRFFSLSIAIALVIAE